MGLSGWGRYPVCETESLRPGDEAGIRAALAEGPLIARGNGRAYGDSAVGARTLHMGRLNRMIDFDPQSGVLVAEAGVLLCDIISAFLPRGWFPMVSPGTKFVTLGGMIAADVHGKNHHVDGSMRAAVRWVEVMGPDGSITRCGPDENTALFDQTCGGMGLTGIILRTAIQLRPVETGWIAQETRIARNLTRAMEIFEETASATYSVAWIDCLAQGDAMGRSLVILGEHAAKADLPEGKGAFDIPAKRKKTVPMDFPGWALNRLSVRAFNTLYWQKGLSGPRRTLVDWDTYFYPLDSILGWNRIYGRRGFVQFQCALPDESAHAGLTALLEAISAAGAGSFLSVLKRFGPQESFFSFPMAGYTLALDFPLASGTLALLERLDAITIDHGGRFYLAKDARMSSETLRQADARTSDFEALRRAGALDRAFSSAQSERLEL